MHSAAPLQNLALIALAISAVIAHPKDDVHLHKHRRQDWSNPALYKDVDWKTVNYGSPVPSPAPAPAPTPAPPPHETVPEKPKQDDSPAPSPKPKQQKQEDTNVHVDSGGGKRGLAYNSSSPSLDAFNSFGPVTWAYNWNSNPSPGAGQNLYVPTLFSDAPDHTGSWESDVKSATSGSGTSYLMAFNEPDQPAPQANMPVGKAVAAFRQYMSPKASDNVKLGSPSVSNGVGISPATGQPLGLDWLKPFLEQCSDCPISFINVHWYGCTDGCPVENDVQAFKTQMQDSIKVAGDRPIWITEFQHLGADQDKFMDAVLPWLDSQEKVEKYAYFMDVDGILAQGNGVSALGQKYGSL